MSKKLIFLFVFSGFLLSMCKMYRGEPTVYANGLSCNNYIDHRFFERRGEELNYYIREEGADCSFTCSDGIVRQTNISGTISSLYSASQAELDAQLCGIAPEPTPIVAPATEAATQPSPTVAASPTSAQSPTPLASPTAQIAVTAGSTSAASVPLLTGQVTMCDTGGNLISFRITQPPADLSGKIITAQIGGQESACYVNATNPSLMTCALPPETIFPAPIVVMVDGSVASEFTYDGLGCARITTPIATTTP